MWTIAGLLLGTMIFVGSYGMLSRYTYKNEVGQALSSFSLVKSTAVTVCQGGRGSEEIKKIILPALVSRVFIVDDNGIEESGDRLCLKMKGRERKCYTLPFCTYEMPTLDLSQEARTYHFMDKILGRRKLTSLVFMISKPQPDVVRMIWNQTYSKE